MNCDPGQLRQADKLTGDAIRRATGDAPVTQFIASPSSAGKVVTVTQFIASPASGGIKQLFQRVRGRNELRPRLTELRPRSAATPVGCVTGDSR